jgi:hypothetical protein
MPKRKNQEAWDKLKSLPIGTHVRVISEMEDDRDPSHHLWISKNVEEPYYAWVVGATWVCNGTVESGHSYSAFMDEPPEYEPPQLTVTRKIPVLLVRRAMFSRAIRVPVDGVVNGGFVAAKGTFLTPPAPIMVSDQPPRDEKGRFVK